MFIVSSYACTTHSPNDNNIVLTSRLWSLKCLFLLLDSICKPSHSTRQLNPSLYVIYASSSHWGFLLTYGSILFSSLTLPRHFTDKRCGSLNWLVFLWDPSWGKSDNEQMRVKYTLICNTI